jgi:hypothetical protein
MMSKSDPDSALKSTLSMRHTLYVDVFFVRNYLAGRASNEEFHRAQIVMESFIERVARRCGGKFRFVGQV